jgi:hypothetical protein
MAKTAPLHTNINTTDIMTKKLILQWTTAMSDLITNHNNGVANIEPVDARRYRYDFYGLLKFIGVADRHLYPHLIANNLDNPTRYLGMNTKIVMLNINALETYYTAFTR